MTENNDLPVIPASAADQPLAKIDQAIISGQLRDISRLRGVLLFAASALAGIQSNIDEGDYEEVKHTITFLLRQVNKALKGNET